MDESADPLRGGDGYVDLADGNLVVDARHGERFASEVVDGGFAL